MKPPEPGSAAPSASDPAPACVVSLDSEPVTIHADEPRDDHAWAAGADDLRFVEDLLLRAEEEPCFGTADGEAMANAVVDHLSGKVHRLDVAQIV